MSDSDRWRDEQSPTRGPSAPPDLKFEPLASGIGVWSAIAIPIVVVGYTRPRGPDAVIIVLGVALGLLAGIIAAVWLASHGGRVTRGPRL